MNTPLTSVLYKVALELDPYAALASVYRDAKPPDHHRTAKGGLLGAGIGAVLGATPGALSGFMDTQPSSPEKRRKIVRNMVLGAVPLALTGGLAGAGLGALSEMDNIQQRLSLEMSARAMENAGENDPVRNFLKNRFGTPNP